MRRWMVGIVTLVAVLALAAPASAKGIKSAKFTGPGLPKGGLFITGDHEGLFGLGALTDPGDKSDKPFSGPTGPAYKAVYRFDFAPGEPVRQIVYPYAAGGLRTYTPPNQSLAGAFVPYGWYQGTPDVFTFLVRSGFPKHAPASVTAGAASGAVDTGSSWPGWAWGLIAGGLGLTVLLVAARQRRRAAVA